METRSTKDNGTTGKTMLREGLEWILYLALAVALALTIVNFVGRFTVVDGNSMSPTLQNKNLLIIENISLRFTPAKPGDIVVVNIPELLDQRRKYAIKRVIAVAGQHVQIQDGKVYVDNAPVSEPYVNGDETLPGEGMYSDLTVPAGCVYLLGDNRLPEKSRDSRVFGAVKTDRIIGKAFLRLFPFSRIGTVP